MPIQAAGEESLREYTPTTISCGECQAMYDITVERWTLDYEANGRTDPRCLRHSDHVVRVWFSGGPCPTCGTPTYEGGFVAFWE